MTNSTPDSSILTDEAIEEILVLRRHNTGPSFGYVHQLCTAIDALCATVKQLRAELSLVANAFELDEAIRIPEVSNLNALQVVEKLAGQQSQLEQLRADSDKWERAAGHWKARHEVVESQLEQLRSMVYVPKILPDDDEITFQEETARLLREKQELWSQLEQLRAENERSARIFKAACYLHTSWTIDRYLMSNAINRCDPAEKADRHIELCKFYVAAVRGCSPEDAMSDYGQDFDRLHEESQELTSSLNTEIGFPLDQTPDYADLNPKFFERFHEIACRVLDAPNSPEKL